MVKRSLASVCGLAYPFHHWTVAPPAAAAIMIFDCVALVVVAAAVVATAVLEAAALAATLAVLLAVAVVPALRVAWAEVAALVASAGTLEVVAAVVVTLPVLDAAAPQAARREVPPARATMPVANASNERRLTGVGSCCNMGTPNLSAMTLRRTSRRRIPLAEYRVDAGAVKAPVTSERAILRILHVCLSRTK